MALKLQNKLIRRVGHRITCEAERHGAVVRDPDNQKTESRSEIVMTAVGSNGLALEFVDCR